MDISKAAAIKLNLDEECSLKVVALQSIMSQYLTLKTKALL